MRFSTIVSLVAVCLSVGIASAQQTPPAAKPAEPAKALPPPESLLSNLTARQLGPTTMGGRVSDLAVYEREPRIFYIATASGGLWKTTNGGITISCVWTGGGSGWLGAVDMSQKNPDLVWIGTGEQNGRNSAGWGDGVYKSTDGGKTWTHMGLKETRHIAQVLIDPKDDDTVYVAACGRLWGRNPERGVYKTTDGGKTWEHILKIDDKTGVNDLVMDPSNHRVLLAGAYERIRYPWNYVSGGPESGLYKTTDAGKTWRKITKGIPEGTIGRIGLDYFRKDPRKVLMQIEAGKMPENPDAPDARPTGTGGVFVSEDRGESWTKVHNRNSRPFYFSIPRWDPLDENRIYIPDVGIGISDDRGKTIRNMRSSVHVDHHAFWINPSDNNHMIIGQDGGVGQTRDRGATWEHLNFMPLGQYYAIGYDMRKPYYVYGGLQDNGTWGGPTQSPRGGVSFWDWYMVNGGDGFYVQVDPEDWATVYAESQGGGVNRIELRTGQRASIRPRGQGLRFNWSTPIHLSPHNPKIVYVGGNRLFRSLSRGDNMEPISPDLTTNDPEKQRAGRGSVTPERTGAENHCTITTIGESPRKAGVIWCGTDDGNVQVTRDHGVTWTNVAPKIPDAPKFGWCTRVMPSRFADGRCYVTFDNHRLDDFATYVYVTEDFGETWQKLNGNLPAEEPCHVIVEGTKNPDLLFLGTEYGLWASVDRGKSWARYSKDFPVVPVHDLAIHPRELDLILGTHGRSIWTLNVSALEELTSANLEKPLHLARPQDVYLMERRTGMGFDGDRVWTAGNTQPGTEIFYYLKEDASGEVKVSIADAAGAGVIELTGTGKAGLNVVRWNARGRIAVVPGDYRITLRTGDKEQSTSVRVERVAFDSP